MPDLYPKFDMPDLVEAVEDTSIAYPKSWLFDFDTGDFVLDGAGNVVEADGLTTWAQWCVKAVLTQRLAFVVYNWDYGVDIENVMKQPTRAVTEAELEKEITEALMTDPRTAEVKNFTFEWSGDELTVSFIIVNAAGVPAEIRVGVGYREVMREFSISKVEQTISDWLRGELVNVEPTENGELVIKSVAQPTFTRNSIAYKSDGSQVAVNVPRFEAGKFGQGILIEEGTTNLLPSDDAQGKTLFPSNNDSYSSNTLETSFGLNDLYSVKSVQLVFSKNQGFFSPSCYPTVAGKVYTFSYYVYNATSTSRNFTAGLIFYDGSGNLVQSFESNSVPVPAQQWKRISVTATAPSDSTQCRIIGEERNSTSQVGDVYYFDSFQLERKPYATSWTVGTRQAENVTVPTAGVLNPQEGTIESWVYVNGVVRRNIDWPTVVLIRKGGSSAANWIWLFHRPNGQWTLQIRKEDGTSTGEGAFSDSLTPDGWHYFAIRWNAQAGTADLFHNGVKRVSLTGVVFPAEYDRINIGYREGGNDYLNSLIDDLRISSRARSDEEIAAAYASGQPLPVDEWTTYLLGFDNNLKVGRGGYRRNKIYLQSLGTCQGSHIEWSAEMPANTTAKVYTSLDDVNFTEAVNGAAIEGLSEGVSLSDKALMIKQIMTTEDASITPKFNRLQYSISGKVYLRG